MRLIDAERLDVFSANCPDGRDIQSFMDGVIAVLSEMDKLPVINFVFCKDCKYFKELPDGNEGVCWRKNKRDYYGIHGVVNGKWYCVDGKRREGQEDDETD